MELKRISAKDNAAVKQYRKLSSSKKQRDAENLFVLEGKRLITDAFENGVGFKRLFITNQSYEKYHNDAENLIKKFATETIIIDDKIGDLMSDTENTQGFFAICDKPVSIDIDTALSKPNGIFIALSRLQDPGNMGTILRTADAMGIDAVFVSGCCEVFSPKTVRSAMGAAFRVKTINISEDDLIGKLKEYNVNTVASVLADDAEILSDNTFSNSKNCVFIGNEGNGLEEKVYSQCDRRVIIPMSENAESLNAAIAAGIFMWEMKKQAE